MSATICLDCDTPACIVCDDVTECAGDGRDHCRDCARDCPACNDARRDDDLTDAARDEAS